MRLSTSGAYSRNNFLADMVDVDAALASGTASRQGAALRELTAIRTHPATPPEWRGELAFRLTNASILVSLIQLTA